MSINHDDLLRLTQINIICITICRYFDNNFTLELTGVWVKVNSHWCYNFISLSLELWNSRLCSSSIINHYQVSFE